MLNKEPSLFLCFLIVYALRGMGAIMVCLLEMSASLLVRNMVMFIAIQKDKTKK